MSSCSTWAHISKANYRPSLPRSPTSLFAFQNRANSSKKNCIYLQPKGHTLRLSNERFHLEPIVKSDAPQYPINGLFRSACDLHNRRICAVILSGTGSDGATSLKELQAASALILAQSPEAAEFSGMPLSAIETGAVDFVLPPSQMGQKIQQFLDRDPESTSTQPTESSPLDQLFDKLL